MCVSGQRKARVQVHHDKIVKLIPLAVEKIAPMTVL